jgi:hypothetical protein
MLDLRLIDGHHDARGAAIRVFTPLVFPENAQCLSDGLVQTLRGDLDCMLDTLCVPARDSACSDGHSSKVAVSCFVRQDKDNSAIGTLLAQYTRAAACTFVRMNPTLSAVGVYQGEFMRVLRIDELKERMRGLRIDELKALLAVMIAGLFVLLSLQALELFAIRQSLDQIKHELRPVATSVKARS